MSSLGTKRLTKRHILIIQYPVLCTDEENCGIGGLVYRVNLIERLNGSLASLRSLDQLQRDYKCRMRAQRHLFNKPFLISLIISSVNSIETLSYSLCQLSHSPPEMKAQSLGLLDYKDIRALFATCRFPFHRSLYLSLDYLKFIPQPLRKRSETIS